MGQSASHHVVLHFADPDHGLSLSTDVAAATGLQSLQKAARTAFPAPGAGKEHVFLAPDQSAISSDADLQSKYKEALEAAGLSAAQPQQSQTAASSLSLGKKQQQEPQHPDFIFHLDVQERAPLKKNEDKSQDELATEYWEKEAELSGDSEMKRVVSADFTEKEGNDNNNSSSTPLHELLRSSFSKTMHAVADSSAAATDFSSSSASSMIKQKQQQQPLAEQLAPSRQRLADVVAVGAGPIGLWTMIQLKVLQPHLRIVMFEKYRVFTRSHVVLLEKNSFWWRPSHPGLTKLVNSLGSAVRTNELESKLMALALELGIVVVIKKVDDVAALVRDLNPLCVVGSDGSHSTVRTTFMTHGGALGGSGLSEDTVIDRTCTIKYEVRVPVAAPVAEDDDGNSSSGSSSKKKIMSSLSSSSSSEARPLTLSGTQSYSLQKLMPYSYGSFQHVSKPKRKENQEEEQQEQEQHVGAAAAAAASAPTAAIPSSTSAAVIILNGLPVEHFSTLSHANFKNPIRLPQATTMDERKQIVDNWQKLHPQLRAAIQSFLLAKRLLVGEDAVLESVKISPVPLRCYRACFFAEVVEVPAPLTHQPEQQQQPAASSSGGGIFSSIGGFVSKTFGSSSSSGGGNADSAKRDLPLRVPTFLVGDSAQGEPYFRAMNSSLLAGSRLANVLSGALGDKSLVEHDNVASRASLASKLASAANSYHMYMVLLAKAEHLRAKAKGGILSVLRGTVQLSSHNPLQVVTLGDSVEKALKDVMLAELKSAEGLEVQRKADAESANRKRLDASGVSIPDKKLPGKKMKSKNE